METSYVDDATFFVTSSKPAGLNDRLTSMAVVVRDTFHEHAMILNWKRGKSEAIVSYKGAGAREQYRITVIDQASTLPIGSDKLRIVAQYKHMGSLAGVRARMRSEIVARSGSMFTQYRPCRKSLYANDGIDEHIRLMLAKSLLFTRLLYNSGVWDQVERSALATLRRAYMAPLRAISSLANGVYGKANTTDDQVCTHLCVPALGQRLAQERVRYFLRFARFGSDQLIHITLLAKDAKASWLCQCMHVLSRLKLTHSDWMHMPDPFDSISQWIRDARERPRQWQAMIRHAFKKSCEEAIPIGEPDLASADLPCEYACIECGASFASTAALHTHYFARHGVRNYLTAHVAGSVCLNCHTQFHTRKRLISHVLYRVPRCKLYYEACVEPMTAEEQRCLESRDALAAKSRDSKALPLPTVPL